LAFVAASRPEDQREIDEILSAGQPADFAAKWLHRRGLDWAASLISQFPLNPQTGDQP
jgi:type IV secretion system protein TrbE